MRGEGKKGKPFLYTIMPADHDAVHISQGMLKASDESLLEDGMGIHHL